MDWHILGIRIRTFDFKCHVQVVESKYIWMTAVGQIRFMVNPYVTIR